MELDPQEPAASAAFAAGFARAIAAAPDAAPGYICFLDAGIAVGAEHMRWAAQRPPWDGTAADDARSMARIADAIPVVGRPWSAAAASLGSLYRAWLDAAQVPTAPLDATDTERLEQARATLRNDADAYHEHQRRWSEAQAALQEVLRTPPGAPGRLRLVLERKAAVSGALRDWQTRGRKASFEAAAAVHSACSSRGLSPALAALRERYDQLLAANRAQDGEAFAPIALPLKIFREDTPWTPIALHAEPPTEPAGPPWQGGQEIGLWWTREPGQDRRPGVGPSKPSLAFEFACARIDRAWFDSFVLTSRSWCWKGASRAAPQAGGPVFSNGEPPPDTRGEWQLIPNQIVFARNLIVGPEGVSSAVVDGIRASATAGLWIFTLRSRLASSLSAGHDVTVTEQGALAVAQMQIVAVVCQRMPREPDPDPALLPG